MLEQGLPVIGDEASFSFHARIQQKHAKGKVGVDVPSKPDLKQEAEPKATLGPLSLRCTIAAMKEGNEPRSRRRSQQPLGRKTFVYLTEEERTLVDQAAGKERRSVSSFIANAAVEAAQRIVDRHSKKR